MAPTDGSDSLDLRVLSHLTAGASTATGVAGELGEPESAVAPILERAVADETAMVLDLPGMPTYALTPKGLAALGVSPAGASTTDERADPAPATPVAPVAPLPPAPAAPSTPREPLAPSAPTVPAPPHQQRVVLRHLLYAAVYVVIGLFLLILQPIIGLLAIAAGLALGAYTLRPLYWPRRNRVNDR